MEWKERERERGEAFVRLAYIDETFPLAGPEVLRPGPGFGRGNDAGAFCVLHDDFSVGIEPVF